MPLAPDQLTITKRTPGQDDVVFVSEHANPLFDQLSQVVLNQEGDQGQLQVLANQILPLPEDPPSKIVSWLAQTLKGAVANKNYDALGILLAADPKLTRYPTACYAIEVAADTNDLRALQMFLEAGWNVNESGQSLRKRPLLRFYLKSPEVRVWLLEHGADPNGLDHWSVTNLESAVMHSDTAIIQDLLDHGGAPANDDSLIMAASQGDVAAANVLLQRGAQINKPEKNAPTPGEPRRKGETALHKSLMAAAMKGEEIIDLLLANGANVMAKNDNGQTPLDLAREIAKHTAKNSIVMKLEAQQGS